MAEIVVEPACPSCFHLLSKLRTKDFKRLVLIAPRLARDAQPGEAPAPRMPDITLNADAAMTGQATRDAQSSPAPQGIVEWCKITQCCRVAARTRDDG